MILLNYAPHPINLYRGDELIETIPSVGIARVSEIVEPVLEGFNNINGDYDTSEQYRVHSLPINKKRWGEVEGLPDPKPGTLLIVSSIVLSVAEDRNDLIVPDDMVRDDSGRILGCRAFYTRA